VSVEGVRWVVTSRELFNPSDWSGGGGCAAEAISGKISFEANRKLIGREAVLRALETGEDPRAIEQKLEQPLRDFLQMRESTCCTVRRISDVGFRVTCGPPSEHATFRDRPKSEILLHLFRRGLGAAVLVFASRRTTRLLGGSANQAGGSRAGVHGLAPAAPD